MRHLPLIFGCVHAVFVAVVFGSAICNPIRASLLPIFVFAADFPLSLLIEWLGKSLGSSRLLFDAFAYLILGSAWFYFIGYLLLRLRGTREI
jgi:hypothetical protein